MEEYSKCELIGRGSPRYLDSLSNLFIVDCITTYQCMVMIVNCTHVHHDATTKYHILLFYCTHVGSATISLKIC